MDFQFGKTFLPNFMDKICFETKKHPLIAL